MIGIVNYGLGNIKAFANIYSKLGIPFLIVSGSGDLNKVKKLILPGVGSFDHAMEKLEKSGMRKSLDEIVLHNHMPILGICVGMQMFASFSEEGNLPGLGWIDGEVKRFNSAFLDRSVCLPHMGWNNFKRLKLDSLLEGIDQEARFYFLHSYYFQCHKSEDVIAVTDYGGEFTCVVNSGNIFGVQFHPEKSHQWGVQLLKNFAKL
ncbi:MAG: imidazole glycerol phosphate synthase subunit HisH [Candidatus Omnitrophica bacterium]|nr:imidazole glycerol phosphate synthase subunit HisH [Candidatus Omnitrophota bacterium]